jgi:hypothetical protein
MFTIMKNVVRLLAVIVSLTIMIYGCKKSSDSASDGGGLTISDVVVTTYTPQDITCFSAVCGGDAIVTQGLSLTEIGVCWSTSPKPTADDAHLSTEKWDKPFVCTITELSPETKYYVRAYALRGLEYYYGEEKSFETLPVQQTLPVIETCDVTDITSFSAVCGGDVISDGNTEVVARGVCWSTTEHPTTNDPHTIDGCGNGQFESYITELVEYTTYYVRAYATNTIGTAYGSEIVFTTESETYQIVGYIDGLFSVSSSKKIYFSQGNLQYQASTNTWRFAENQWDYVGFGNQNISWNYDGWIDLFGWGTSGYENGAECYQPWSCSMESYDYNVYGCVNCSLYYSTGEADWGYNAISNGGNKENLWHTLTMEEWNYVFNTRNTLTGLRFVKAYVHGVHGVVLFPDNWNNNVELNNINTQEADYYSNIINDSDWMNVFEANGAVFLPAAGYRNYHDMYNVNDIGYYWTSTHATSSQAYRFHFDHNFVYTAPWSRYIGLSVRLVCVADN